MSGAGGYQNNQSGGYAKAAALAATVAVGVSLFVYFRRRMADLKSKELRKLDVVGGHAMKNKPGSLPMLQCDGRVYKPFQAKSSSSIVPLKKTRGEVEAEFYASVYELSHPLRAFMPRYFGVETVDDVKYLVLEDATHGMKRPCVLDLKMGRRAYDEDASHEKQLKELRKYPPQEEIGFRICGMRVFQKHTNVVLKSTREWCLNVTADTVPDALEKFFFDGKRLRRNVVSRLIDELQKIANCIKKHPKWRFYGSSILVAYDGDASSPDSLKLKVKMIDFSHVYPIKDKGGKDYGYLHGVFFLMQSLTSLLDERKSKRGRRSSLAHVQSLVEKISDDVVTHELLTARTNGSGSGAKGTAPTRTESDLDSVLMATSPQVGGAHGNITQNSVGEIIKTEDKPEQFDRELSFYEAVSATDDSLSHATCELLGKSTETKPRYIVLRDARASVATRKSSVVSVMDVKLGLRSYNSCETPNEPKKSYFEKYAKFSKKLLRDEACYWRDLNCDPPSCLSESKLGKRDYLKFRDASTTSAKHGFRLTACVRDARFSVSSDDSRSLETLDQFNECLEKFLHTNGSFDAELAAGFINEIDDVLRAVSRSEIFRTHEFVGTSLLLLHCDGVPLVKWIDFAQTHDSPDREADDNGVVFGIQSLRDALERLTP